MVIILKMGVHHTAFGVDPMDTLMGDISTMLLGGDLHRVTGMLQKADFGRHASYVGFDGCHVRLLRVEVK